LTAGDGYLVGAPSSATVIIGDGSVTAPTLIATPLDGRRIQLEWSDTTANETGFEIERLSGAGWIPVTTLEPNVTTFTDTHLTPATTYTYRVRATTGQPSNEAPATTWRWGDANGDGKANFTDYLILERNLRKSPAQWTDGDFDDDQTVGHSDFMILLRNFAR
jgi:hypothetical protein